MTILPVGLRADDLEVLVVGCGRAGARKAHAFLSAGAWVTIVAAEVTEELLAGSPRLRILQREFTEDDVGDVDLVVAATSDPDVNARVSQACRARRILCNRADDPGEGTFDTLAVHRSGPLVIGVAAGVPGAAARIRDEIARRFDSRYGDALERMRVVRHRLRDSGAWTEAADALVAGDFCDAVETGAISRRLAAWE